MVDILNKGKNGWDFYEVKSATDIYKDPLLNVKDVYVKDVAIQYYVLKGSGLDIASAFLVHIDNKYVRKGPLEVNKLFAKRELTDEVVEMQQEVIGELGAIRKTLGGNEPAIDIGVHCDKPYECDFKAHCWPEEILNGYSIFNISGLSSSKKFELYKSGVIKLVDVPDDFPLSDNQRFQVETELK